MKGDLFDVYKHHPTETNNGPFTLDELNTHVETVHELLAMAEYERYEYERHITKVTSEGEGHGVLVEYEMEFSDHYTRTLLDNGYVVATADGIGGRDHDGRVFIMPIDELRSED